MRIGSGELDMPDEQGRVCIYLAGPDVFYPDALQRADRMKAVLAERGLAGWFPLDNTFDPAACPDGKALALAIARANEAMMRRADLVLANIQPWRGPEADDGTAFEIGFMAALGKPVVLYTNDPRPFSVRISDDVYDGKVYADGPYCRGVADDMMVEDFDGFADNLMLINAAVTSAERAFGRAVDPADVVQHGFEAAADFARRIWLGG
jgi:nucleoside 2-deoxyribosyltransferase